jgi:DNA topoisomerase IA
VRNDATQQFSPTQLGKSLVTGYEHLGIELARPQFRSKMEQDMKDIALGRQNKYQVISYCYICVRILLCVCPHAIYVT